MRPRKGMGRNRALLRTGAVVALSAIGFLCLPAVSSSALSLAPDLTWRVNGRVFALARDGNTIFAGGDFTSVVSPDGTQHGQARNLAAFDAATGAWIPSFAVRVTDAEPDAWVVRALGVSTDGRTLYIGGQFDHVNGQPRSNLAAVDAGTGALRTAFAPDLITGSPGARFATQVSNVVNAILVGPSLVYFGGTFQRVDTKPRSNLAAVAPDGTLDPNWHPSANDTVRSLARAPGWGSIFVGGKFTTVDGVERDSVARVSPDTGALDPWAIPAGTIDPGNPAWALVATQTRLFGGFGNRLNYVAAFHLDTGAQGTKIWRHWTVGNVESLALAPHGNRLFFGGHFGTARLQQQICGTLNLRGLAAVDAATGQWDCSWAPHIVPWGGNFIGAWAVLSTPTQLWVGGFFTSISGVPQSGIARFTF